MTNSDKEFSSNALGDFSFGKSFKLCAKNDIDALFSNGKSVFNKSMKLKYLSVESPISSETNFQCLISVPKRSLKKAHDRNRIKRLIREVVRKNKSELFAFLQEKEINLHFAIIYQYNKLVPHQEIESDFGQLLKQLFKKL